MSRDSQAKILKQYIELDELRQAVERAWMLSQQHSLEMARLDKLHVLLVDARDQANAAMKQYRYTYIDSKVNKTVDSDN